MITLKIGADPEVFVRDSKTRNFISGHDLCPGTKAKPHTCPGGAIQVDGLALEYNIDACQSAESFVWQNLRVMKHLKNRVQGMNKDYAICIAPCVNFEEGYFQSLPKEVKRLGCDADYSAYTELKKTTPDITDFPVRMASGHIHLGWLSEKNEAEDVMAPWHFGLCVEVTKQLDRTLGIASWMWDPEKERRRYYGELGTFRPKKYGVEYRVMSNQWLKADALMKYVYTTAVESCRDLHQSLEYYVTISDQELFTLNETLMNESSPSSIRKIVKNYFKENSFLPEPPEV